MTMSKETNMNRELESMPDIKLRKREEESKQVSRDRKRNNASREERTRKRSEVVKQSAGSEETLQPRIDAAKNAWQKTSG